LKVLTIQSGSKAAVLKNLNWHFMKPLKIIWNYAK